MYETKLCPECKNIMHGDSYFQAYKCTHCNYYHKFEKRDIEKTVDTLLGIVSVIIDSGLQNHCSAGFSADYRSLHKCKDTINELKKQWNSEWIV